MRSIQISEKRPNDDEHSRHHAQVLESVCKDVECFFGILKGRSRILGSPILTRTRKI